MEIIKLSTVKLNQNQYNRNSFTPENIGSLLIYPIEYTPENYLSCDGYILKIVDYTELYSTIGKKFNIGSESLDEFRIPDYNITGRFLQPNSNPGKIFDAGLPNIWGEHGCYQNGYVGGGYVVNGAFYVSNGWAWSKASSGDTGSRSIVYGFNASRCSAIYGKSSTVQPPSQGVHVCIRYK